MSNKIDDVKICLQLRTCEHLILFYLGAIFSVTLINILTGADILKTLILTYAIFTVSSIFLIKNYWADCFKSYTVNVALIFLLALLSLHGTYDITSDSQTDHIRNFYSIVFGWNPSDLNSQSIHFNSFDYKTDLYHNELASRPAYYLFLVGYLLTGVVDFGRYGVGILVAIILIYSIITLRHFYTKKFTFIYSIMIVFSPVVISFLTSHYVDHILYISIILAILAATNFIITRRNESIGVLCLAFFLMTSIKLSAIACSIIFLLIFENITRAEKIVITKKQYLIIILSILVGWYDPYLKSFFVHGTFFNFFSHGDNLTFHQLYRAIWPGKEIWFEKTNFALRLIQSIYSEYAINPDNVPNFKIPLNLTKDEILQIKNYCPDARISGNGPLFSAIFTSSIFLLVIGFSAIKKTKMPILLLTGIAISVLINPFAFWYRFVPQLYLIPILIVLTITSEKFSIKKNFLYFLSNFVVTLIILNNLVLLMGGIYQRNIMNIENNNFIAALNNTAPKNRNIYFENWDVWRFRLDVLNIKYNSSSAPCLNAVTHAPRSNVALCKN